jgi:PKD repeat protein
MHWTSWRPGAAGSTSRHRRWLPVLVAVLVAAPVGLMLQSSASWIGAAASGPAGSPIGARGPQTGTPLSLDGSGSSSGAGIWTQISFARCCGAIAYSVRAGDVLLFGGRNSTTYLGDTWTYHKGNWTQVLASESPSPRAYASVAYDTALGTTILFGGFNGTYLGDTWMFAGGGWTPVVTPIHPSARDNASMTYDAKDGYLLLFGGQNGTFLNDTWAYNATGWHELNPATSPTPRAGATMAYDTHDREAILFGGNGSTSYLAETWAFSAGTWTHLTPATHPSGRDSAAMAYDPTISRIALFGGYNSGGYLADTWTFTASSGWTSVAGPGPSARGSAMMVFDAAPADDYLVLVGGLGHASTYSADTWAYTLSGWTEVLTGAVPTARQQASEFYDEHDGYVLLFGGRSSGGAFLGDTWIFKSGWWTELSLSPAPSARAGAAMIFDEDLNVVVLFGGYNASGYLNDTWTFHTGVWTLVSTVSAPAPRAFAAFAFDSKDNYDTLFGGYNGTYLGDTWTYSAGTWTHLSPVLSPSARSNTATAYDAFAREVVLFGGRNATGLQNDTWVFSAGSWTHLTEPTAPTPRQDAAIAFDPTGGYVILFGGAGATSNLSDMWKFRAGGWTQLLPLVSPEARSAAGLAYDTNDLYAVLFGGGHAAGVFGDTWIWTVLVVKPLGLPNPATVNATVSFSSIVFGGLSPYTYYWQFGDGNTSHGTSAPTHAYTKSGAYDVTLEVNDSASNSVNATFVEIVNPAIHLTATAVPTATDAGVSVMFNSTATSGTPPFTYAWAFGDGGTNASENTTHAYAIDGTYTAEVWANDSGGGNSTIKLTITVSATPTVSIGAVPSPTDTGQAVTFTPTTVGGTGPFTYGWEFGDGSTSTLQSPSHTYSTAGAYKVNLSATDAVGKTALTNITLTVNSPPTATASASPTTAEVGTPVTFTGTPSGGSAPFNYTWLFADGSKTTGQSPVHAFTATGTYLVTLYANDSAGASAMAQVTVTVVAGPSASASATPTPVDTGILVSFTGSATGGAPPYVFAWNFGDGSHTTGQDVTHAYSAPGTYTAKVWANDSLSGSGSKTVTITVVASPSAAIGATPAATDVGIATAFAATVTGGVAPISYAWLFGDGASSTGATADHTYSTPGTFTVDLWANDSLATSAFSTLAFTVNAALSVTGATASPAKVTLGDSTTLSITTTGGTAPLKYAYTGLPTGCSSADTAVLVCKPTQTGTYSVVVNVTDAAGASVQKTVSLTVTKSISTFLGLPAVEGYALLAAIILIIVGGVALAIRASRRSRRGGAAPPPASGTGSSTPWAEGTDESGSAPSGPNQPP